MTVPTVVSTTAASKSTSSGRLVQGRDVIAHVLGEAAVDGHPLGSVALRAVSVVEAVRVRAAEAVGASHAAPVCLGDDAVADRELVDGTPDRCHHAGVLVPGDELVDRRAAVGEELAAADLQVGAAQRGAAHVDEDVVRPELRHWHLAGTDDACLAEDRGLHVRR